MTQIIGFSYLIIKKQVHLFKKTNWKVPYYQNNDWENYDSDIQFAKLFHL